MYCNTKRRKIKIIFFLKKWYHLERESLMKENIVTSFVLKIIAVITMTMDHYSKIADGPEWFSLVGRVSFPLFAFLIGEGFRYTKDRKKYFYRIFLYALVLQIPDLLSIEKYDGNIFFTLSFGILSLLILNNTKLNKFIKIILVIIIAVSAEMLTLDYGSYGVMIIIIFYLFRENNIMTAFSFTAVNILWISFFQMSATQLYSIFVLPLIFLYNGKEGKKMKLFFYLYYPLHLIVLYLLAELKF